MSTNKLFPPIQDCEIRLWGYLGAFKGSNQAVLITVAIFCFVANK
jgi:hypothetical protein